MKSNCRILRTLGTAVAMALALWLCAMPAATTMAEEQAGADEGAYSREKLLTAFDLAYTPEELAAIDRALWAANMDRHDLRFNKDFTKGYQCFPVVRRMMDDPLIIAPFMDKFVDGLRGGQGVLIPTAAASCWENPQMAEALHEAQSQEFIPAHKGVARTTDELLDGLAGMLAAAQSQLQLPWSDEELELLREFLPQAMAWHEVFDSTVGEERHKELEAKLENEPDEYLFELASRVDVARLLLAHEMLVQNVRSLLPGKPDALFPSDEPVVRETPFGRIALGTTNDDYYEGDYAVLIEPGGNDHYKNCRLGAAYGTDGLRAGFFADMEGDDFYDCGETNITLGAAVLGVGVFADMGMGNDRYVSGSCTLGAAIGGAATFYDDGGSDIYEGKVFTQGAAGFGIGVMRDASTQRLPEFTTDEGMKDPIDIRLFDNDSYRAWTNSQAFARTLGVALCVNERGNEVYEAGGVYLHAPLFADRYQSFSQGFAIGERGIDYAGGIALLIDYDGNDRYLGDVYNQGVGYWYSAGLLWDGGGNDTYEMTQYGQGSGIHLAIGGLVDVSGNDTYVMHSGLGQGGSHDYAASILHDRGGNDHYMGMTSCNGSGLTNAVGIHIDRSGNDTYAGRRTGGINFGRPARGTSSIGVLVDLAGTDDYLGIMKDGEVWRHTDIGVGVDVQAPPVEDKEAAQPAPEKAEEEIPARVQIPEVCSYEGELTQEVFDELWEISIRWEVGDNRYIVPKARERLVAFGADVLPYVSKAMDSSASGLALRAFVYILGKLNDDFPSQVAEVLRQNATSDNETRRRVALYLIGELKLKALEDVVAGFLDDEEMRRRAIGVLGQIESHAADEMLIEYLSPESEEPLILTSLSVLTKLEADCYPQLRRLLDYPLMSVREALVNRLVEHESAYGDAARGDVVEGSDLSLRARRTLLSALARFTGPPDASLVAAVADMLSADDWGLRADAVRVVRHWQTLEGIDEALIAPAVATMNALLANETDPYVRFAGEEERSS